MQHRIYITWTVLIVAPEVGLEEKAQNMHINNVTKKT